MKDLIALCAVFILLMTFPLQYALNTKNHYSMSLMQKHVNNAKEMARQEGYFTPDILNDLKSEIAEDFAVEEDVITIVATDISDKKQRGELIYYKVSVPINQIIAANIFWGIDEENNKGQYTIESYAASEWVAQ